MKEKVLRYQDNQEFDIDKHMRELDEINEKYINAAEAKMSLINKLGGNSKAKSSRQSEVAISQQP
jgi:hypothetical protein